MQGGRISLDDGNAIFSSNLAELKKTVLKDKSEPSFKHLVY